MKETGCVELEKLSHVGDQRVIGDLRERANYNAEFNQNKHSGRGEIDYRLSRDKHKGL